MITITVATVLLIILKALSIMIGILIFSSLITLIPDYKYYSKTYKQLDNLTFTRSIDLIISEEYDIIWFFKSNSFKIGPNNYIHNKFFTYCNPYTLYWLIKYKKWFNTNYKHLTWKH